MPSNTSFTMPESPNSIEVLFTPTEFGALASWDLRQTVCVVFDVLRATSTMVTALANGAAAVVPVAEIPEALEFRARQPDVLLAGERGGLRIRAAQTGSLDFDLGNSPREFTPERVRGRTIVMTTTNGTRGLRACAAAREVLVGAFLNLGAIARHLERRRPRDLLLVCSGTLDQAAYEDTLAAGALCDLVWPAYSAGTVADSAHIARDLYRTAAADLAGALRHSRNARRLLAKPELADDVPACLRRDQHPLVARLEADGRVILKTEAG